MYCGNYCESKGSIRQDLKGCWKHKLLRKKAKFPVRKIIWGPFFSYYRVWQTVGDILRGSTSFSYHCCIISRTIFSRPKKLLTSQVFENKGKINNEEKNMDFFPVILNMTNVRKHFIGVHKVIWQKLRKR